MTIQPHQLCSPNKELPPKALRHTRTVILLKGERAIWSSREQVKEIEKEMYWTGLRVTLVAEEKKWWVYMNCTQRFHYSKLSSAGGLYCHPISAFYTPTHPHIYAYIYCREFVNGTMGTALLLQYTENQFPSFIAGSHHTLFTPFSFSSLFLFKLKIEIQCTGA